MSSIHGHDVLAMIAENHFDNAAQLLEAMQAKFGAEATYHTCAKSGLTAQELIAFLEKRQKFTVSADSPLTVNAERICNH